MMLVLHLLVKIDYIAALVQLLGHELHDLSNRNVNKPPVTETRKTRVLKNYEPDGDGRVLVQKKNIYIYIFNRLD